MESNKNDTKELIHTQKNRLKNFKTKLMITKGEMGGGTKWEVGTDIYTLLYMKRMSSKDLLYSTGKSTQYPVVTYTGK